jgi:hypothetical protein
LASAIFATFSHRTKNTTTRSERTYERLEKSTVVQTSLPQNDGGAGEGTPEFKRPKEMLMAV